MIAALESGNLIDVTCSPLPYVLDGAFKLSENHADFRLEKIDRMCRDMIDSGATTFYETPDGASDFDGAGSLCHAWSSIHCYYYGRYVLGIKPASPGFRTFEVDIHPGRFNRAAGEIPTPDGKIRIEWERKGNQVEIKSLLK